jgi:hypothetical protein
MSLLLLLRSPDTPTTQAGYRSLLAFWIGGASSPTGFTPYTRSRVVNAVMAAGGTGYTRGSIVNSGGI